MNFVARFDNRLLAGKKSDEEAARMDSGNLLDLGEGGAWHFLVKCHPVVEMVVRLLEATSGSMVSTSTKLNKSLKASVGLQ